MARLETQAFSGDGHCAGLQTCFVIKMPVFKYILSSLLERPPTFLAKGMLGSAEFCGEFLAFMFVENQCVVFL